MKIEIKGWTTPNNNDYRSYHIHGSVHTPGSKTLELRITYVHTRLLHTSLSHDLQNIVHVRE